MQRTRPFSLSSSLLLGIALLFPLRLLGADQSAPEAQQPAPEAEQSVPDIQEPLPQAQPPSRFDSVEVRRDYLSDKVARFASSMDRFFGGDRHYQESNESVVQMSIARAMGYGGDPKFNLAAKVHIKLPVTEGRFHLLLETDPEKNITPEKNVTTAPTPTQGRTVLRNKVVVPESLALAARYTTPEEKAWHFNIDGGLKFPIPVKPFVRTRGSYSTMVGEWRLKASESVYWFSNIGAGETTLLDLERVISTPLLFRASTNATWLNDTKNFDLRQDLSVYHTLNDRTALLYQASAVGVSNPQLQVTDYVLLAFCRYRLHQKWLFFEVSPQLHFPRERNYKTSAALIMRLEVLFDESR